MRRWRWRWPACWLHLAQCSLHRACLGGCQPDGRGGCVYVNPAPGYLANPIPYRICSTKLVAGVAVRSCSYGANPTVERRGR